MFAIIRTRWQTGPLSRRAKRRSSAAPGSPRKKYAGILHPPNMVRLLINSTTSGDRRKPVLYPGTGGGLQIIVESDVEAVPEPATIFLFSTALLGLGFLRLRNRAA